VVHIVGPDVQVGSVRRQRCVWCGVLLEEYDLARVAAPVGQDPTPPVWPQGGLVLVDGNMTATVPHEDGAQLPDNACDRLPVADPMTTLVAAAFPELHSAGMGLVNVQAAVEEPADFFSPVRRFRITGDLVAEA
jgi:hypothetical protein